MPALPGYGDLPVIKSTAFSTPDIYFLQHHGPLPAKLSQTIKTGGRGCRLQARERSRQLPCESIRPWQAVLPAAATPGSVTLQQLQVSTMGRAAALLALLPQQHARDFVIKSMFNEVPDRGAALAAMSLWAAVSCVLVVLTTRTRTWFMLIAATAGFMQLAGYALRASLLVQARPQLNYLTAMVALFLISPSLLAVTSYICLGKLLYKSSAAAPPTKLRSSDHESVATDADTQHGSGLAGAVGALLRVCRLGSGQRGCRFGAAKIVTAAFCIGELFALMLQGVGAALVATSAGSSKFNAASRRKQKDGRWLLLAGVCMQLVVFTVFAGLALTVKFGRKFGYAGTGKFTAVFACLFATIVCQYVRQIFRVVVYVSGLTSYLATHERFGVYGFDFAPLCACGMLFCCLNFGLSLGSEPLRVELQQQSSSKSSSRAVLVQEGLESAEI